MSQIDEEIEQKAVNEEYKIWKKNSPFLYDMVMSSALEWPSLTVQWFPTKKIIKDNNIDYSIQKLILGTHTSNKDTNYLLIAEVRLPTINTESLKQKYQDSCDIYGGFGGAAGKIEIVQKIVHKGEVNRARYCPHNPNLIATKTNTSEIHLFDTTKHSNKPNKNNKQAIPNLILKGHNKEGYGLDWNIYDEGLLLSGSDDSLICVWDIKKQLQIFNTNKNNNNNNNNNNINKILPSMNCIKKYNKHNNRVEDVEWSKKKKNLFASCGDDKSLRIWDIKNSKKESLVINNAHKQEINCLSWSPYNDYLIVTGGGDKVISLWDIRHTSTKLHCLEGHASEVYQVEWMPQSEIHLGSCGADRRCMLWDLSQIGMEQSPEDAEDGPPELLFIHGGHTDKVSDFSFNPNDPWVCASVSDNNIVQIWQMTDELLCYDDLTQHAQLE